MLDCLDKQQRQQLEQARQESVFWPQHQQIQASQPQQAQLAPNSAASYDATQMVVQQHGQKKQLLVDIEQSGQLEELEASAIQQQQQQGVNNDLIGYYFGSISRETAEWILKNHGNRLDGAYLLRSSGPKDDFVLSLMVVHGARINADASSSQQQAATVNNSATAGAQLEVLHYKIVETDDSFVALHGQVGDEKFATIDELIEKAQGVATKPKWPIQRQSLESQILPPTFWGLTVDQIRLAILIKAKQWGFPLSIFQQPTMLSANTYQADQQQTQAQSVAMMGQAEGETGPSVGQTVTTLDNETIRTLIYKSLHEFQPWFHGRISRDEAERRIEEGPQRDGRFLVRERDNFSYAMCISHKRTTKHYRIDVLSTGELAIQDGRKFTSLMALVSHYTIMSDGLWCALTEPCPRPIQHPANKLHAANQQQQSNHTNFQQGRFAQQICAPANQFNTLNQHNSNNSSNIYCVPPSDNNTHHKINYQTSAADESGHPGSTSTRKSQQSRQASQALMCPNQNAAVLSIKAPIKEWLHSINHRWSQLIASKTNQQHQSLNSFLFGPSNPLNNHCRHKNHHHHHHHHHHHQNHRRGCKSGCSKHPRDQSQTLNSHRQHRAPSGKTPQQQHGLMMSGACNCYSLGGQGLPEGLPHPAVAMLQNGSATNGGLGASGPPLRPMPSNNMNLQLGQASLAQTQSSLDQTKALLSCLPQNSGFMLDSQSFIGSPLFVVRQNSHAATIDGGPNGAGPGLARACSNGVGGAASGSSGSGNSGGERVANNVEKLISPAQSISANLNGHQSNPYALNTDIYGSQTSTAIVNDHLLTSSSSSSGNNHSREQRPAQTGVDLKRHLGYRHPLSAPQNASNLTGTRHPMNDNIRLIGQMSNPTATLKGPSKQTEVRHFNGSNQNNVAILSEQSRLPQTQPSSQPPRPVPIQHAGPILCGQHAGPAYRYTNCTSNNEDNAFRPCLHSASLAMSNSRAVDDLHLPTPSTQLAGPAALTKFVQFQDGQCLRTHRDTRSIQMAYLLSRQEALNVLNSRGSSRLNQNQPSQQQQSHNYPAAHSFDRRQNRPDDTGNKVGPRDGSAPQNGLSCNTSQQQADFDLIDCDGSGFQFKYDPKLIKSSSIETLCGAGDEDDDEANIIEDLSQFKTNSELLMSLQPNWFAATAHQATNDDLGFSPLIPMPAGGLRQDDSRQSTGLIETNGQAQVVNQSEKSDYRMASLLYDSARNNEQNEHQFNESWSRKHNLDELTTSMLAELTASLKAQVDLKNKRSGLCTSAASDHDPLKQPNSFALHPNEANSNQQPQLNDEPNRSRPINRENLPEPDPLELINEFDTLIRGNK